jgi:hypothetical protein
MVTVIQNGVNGYASTDPSRLLFSMQKLLKEKQTAKTLGIEARRTALGRFGIRRFVADWNAAFKTVTQRESLAA